jgi:glyoxylase-like metal-dependent hydrolase (beta-lactamase superfamily II)
MMSASALKIHEFFDRATFTLTYVAYDTATLDAVIIDPVLDFDPLGATTRTTSLAQVVAYVTAHKLRVHYILETHAHADHITGAQALRTLLGAKTVIGNRITEVQKTFQHIFDMGSTLPIDGSQFDRLAHDGERIEAGALSLEVIATPGHTPACVSYKIEDAVFTGDTLFIEDYGTGRCDFPGGSASELYASVHDRLYVLPESTRVFVGHDYQPGQRDLRFMTTIGESKRSNIQLREMTSAKEFIKFRTARDATLSPPQLLFQSVQMNINAGKMPPAHANGLRYLVVPLNLFRPHSDELELGDARHAQ